MILAANLIPLAERIKVMAGENTNPKRGKLAAGIYTKIQQLGSKVLMQVGVDGVPYAQAQEMGATYDAREILPSKANVLAFVGSFFSGTSFAASVQWPGATVPPKHYILKALQANRQAFRDIALASMVEAMSDSQAGSGT
jgi:hypothetical protein